MKTLRIKFVATLLTVLLCHTNAADDHDDEHHDDHWCHNHDESIDAFDAAKAYLNVSTPGFHHGDVEKLIEMTMFRLGCDVHEPDFPSNMTCSECLTADNIFQVLKIDTTLELDETAFHRAATIIMVFAYQLDDKCSSPPDWSTVTYEDFLEELMHFHAHDHEDEHLDNEEEELDLEDHHDNEEDGHNHEEDHHDHGTDEHDHETDEHDHETDEHDHEEDNHDHEMDQHDDGDIHEEEFFDFHQVEALLAEVNETYRPGQYGIQDPDVEVICADDEQESFRARDIITNTDPEHIEGIQESELGMMSAHIVARILQGYCIRSDRAANDNLPDEEDFLRSIYSQFDDEGHCTLDEHGLEGIMALLSIGGSEDDHDHDHEHAVETTDTHDGHDHRRKKRNVVTNINKRQVHQRVRRADDDHDHDHESSFLPNVSALCMTPQDLLSTYFMNAENVSVSRDDFIRLCPALLQQSIQGCPNVAAHSDEGVYTASNAEKYGYGTVAAFIVSACAAFGLVIGKSRKRDSYTYVMSVMLGLAFGSLVGDALLHLVPHGLVLHDHDHAHAEEGPIEVEPFVWKLFATCGSVYLFLILEMILSATTGGHGHSHGLEPTTDRNKSLENGSYSMKEAHVNKGFEADDMGSTDFSKTSTSNGDLAQANSGSGISDDNQGVALMIIIGDAIHNFADGMAMGAAFSQDWRSGVSTSLAIFCHELPHEFGDVAVLLTSGWSMGKVALAQIGSAMTCFIGMYIGCAIGEKPVVREWIYIVAAGMFLYIALSDVVPEIMSIFRNHRSKGLIFTIVNIGALIGFGIMVVIAIFEERIAI